MLKILIADDEKYERDSVINLIEENFKDKLTIYQGKNGREAIEIAEQVRPDIIIMDIKMPGINGIKAIEEIKKTLSNTYFIMLTAYDYFDFAIEAVKLNVKEYLLKPFSRSELINKISNAVESVENTKAKRKSDIEKEEKISNLIGVLENELSYSIINNTLDSIDFNMHINYLDLNFDNSFAVSIKILSSNFNNKLKRQVGDYISELLRFKYKAIGTYCYTENLIFFIQIDKYKDINNEIRENTRIINDIKREIERHFNIKTKIGIGDCYSGINLMYKSYEEANKALDYETEGEIIHNGKIDISSYNQDFEKEKSKLFKKVTEYIDNNIQEDLNLDIIANNFNLSPYYFSRSFKEVMKCNLIDYINIVRIKKAKELLKKNEMSIKEICYSVGYSDPNYFSKVFKKYEGYSPKEYKFK